MERYRGAKTHEPRLSRILPSLFVPIPRSKIFTGLSALDRSRHGNERFRADARAGGHRIDHATTKARSARSSTTISRRSLSARAGSVERMEVEPGRFNVLACWGKPLVTLSTHMDTVPPFFASRDDARIHLGARLVRREGHHRGDDRRGGKAARRGPDEFRLALRRRRGAKQRRRGRGGAIAARLALSR